MIYGNPPIPKAREQTDLIQQAVRYMAATHHEETASPEILIQVRADRMDIQKVGPCLGVLYPEMTAGVRMSPFCFHWCSPSDGRAELSRAIGNKLECARTLLSQEDCAGVILLLHNCCALNFWLEFRRAARDMEEVSAFHSVFLIQEVLSADPDEGGRVPHCLHTREPLWETSEDQTHLHTGGDEALRPAGADGP